MNKVVNKRNVSGFLLLDKTQGISSNKALQQVKHLFQAKKAGHTGSLDPLACGMLPIAFGEATKFSQFFLDADKHYTVIAKLGERTNTSDAEGEITATAAVPNFNVDDLIKKLTNFIGEISQLPPMYSALKHQGKPLYKLARQGIEIERKKRLVHIDELILVDYRGAQLTLKVRCSKGTYIRTLIDDIGIALGCYAHVSYLRRDWVAPFINTTLYTYAQLMEMDNHEQRDHCLIPIETALAELPMIILDPTATFHLCRGQAVFVPQVTASGTVRLFSSEHIFLGIGEMDDNANIAPKRLINIIEK